MGYSFEELVDIQQLNELMEQLHGMTRIPSAIFDDEGNILIATGWQELCTRFHRQHPVTAARCQESNHYIQEHLHKEKYVIYKCRNGLCDVAVPIMLEEKHVGTLFLGQFFFEDEAPDVDFFVKQADEFGFNLEEYLIALNHIPVFSRQKIQKTIKYIVSFVKLISILGRNSLEQAQHIQEQKQMEEALRKKTNELNEGLKELNCLYSMSRLVEQKGRLTGEIIQGTVNLIPPAFVDPEKTSARAVIRDQAFQTENFRETSNKLRRTIFCHDENIGRLEVCYLGKDLDENENCFLDGERNLIDVIGERLGRIIERNQAEEALSESKEQLYQAQKMETLGTLVAGVAHEINNPANMIMLNVRLLQKIWIDFHSLLAEKAEKEPPRKFQISRP